jgi:flagellar basal body-associated protein FliL
MAQTLVGLLLAAGILLGGPGATRSLAAEANSSCSPSLEQLPSDTVAFVSVRVRDLWRSDVTRGIRHLPARVGECPDLPAVIKKGVGIGLDKIEVATLALCSNDVELLIINSRETLNEAELAAALLPGAKAEKVNGKNLYTNQSAGDCFALLDEHTLIRCDKAAPVREILAGSAPKKAGAFESAVRRLGAQSHQLVAGCNMAYLRKSMLEDDEMASVPAIRIASKATIAFVVCDLGADSRMELELQFASESQAKAGVQAIQAGVDFVRSQLLMAGIMGDVEGLPEVVMSKKACRFCKVVEKSLQGASVEARGRVAHAACHIECDLATVSAGLAGLFRLVGSEFDVPFPCGTTAVGGMPLPSGSYFQQPPQYVAPSPSPYNGLSMEPLAANPTLWHTPASCPQAAPMPAPLASPSGISCAGTNSAMTPSQGLAPVSWSSSGPATMSTSDRSAPPVPASSCSPACLPPLPATDAPKAGIAPVSPAATGIMPASFTDPSPGQAGTCPPPIPSAIRPDQTQQLAAIEKKLDALMTEVDALRKESRARTTAAAKDEADVLVRFGEVVVNLADAGTARILHVKLVLVVAAGREKEVGELLQKKKSVATSLLIGFLTGKSVKDVHGSAAAVAQLRQEIREKLTTLLFPERKDTIRDVLFEDFVIQ